MIPYECRKMVQGIRSFASRGPIFGTREGLMMVYNSWFRGAGIIIWPEGTCKHVVYVHTDKHIHTHIFNKDTNIP